MAARLSSTVAAWALCLALPLAAQPAGAQQDGWQSELTEQMQREYDCEVAFLSQVAERSVNGDLVILAKVHCLDKRTFDAYRDSAFGPFEIHPCENPDNRVC
ncbi:hypothetical protein AAFN88_19330 [Pelagibius sp. CAU 1746]|uniref:hypothetical protein n=1 Tax=Pelagibius sp. CAU 1746 TaxID=3140370 RepID=UPI00325A61D8